MAAQQHGLVVLDHEGEVLRPAKLWNDTESAQDTEELLAELAGGRGGLGRGLRKRAPAGLHRDQAALVAPLRARDACAGRPSVMLPHDWLTFRLTGRRVTDRGDASGTGYWSPAESRYRVDLLEELVDAGVDWEAALPEVLCPAHRRRRVAADGSAGRPGNRGQHGGRPRARAPARATWP